jgi:putative photosynthetic complex assembly protein 2
LAEHGFTFVLVILAWWLSTGLVMWLCALPKRTFAWSFAAASFLLILSIYGLIQSASNVTAAGAYIAFASALGIWGWIEMSFLMGFITGPRTAPCPADAKGFRRFALALEALLYHELAIVIAAAGVVALTWDAPNQTGTFAFLILMAMRISAKLNIFLGVPNLTDEFLPERLGYLKSYFRKRDFNLLFPVSIVLSAAVAAVLAQRVIGADGAEAVGFALLLALVALAMLEHFFMIMPLPDAVLWRWAIPAATKPIDKVLP